VSLQEQQAVGEPDGHRREIELLTAERDAAQRALARARAHQVGAASERDRLAERLLEAEQELSKVVRLERIVQEQARVVEAMEATLSWRITGPLRALRRLSGKRPRE
jgi:hypothetical protein